MKAYQGLRLLMTKSSKLDDPMILSEVFPLVHIQLSVKTAAPLATRRRGREFAGLIKGSE